ncbi:hypothetical protein DM02DRAFT_38709 [Periconia macrospinosa]|uniref:Uncharacterized protein n=1 Tax=Periconia macrospinosa TaxID=97972 RepID=A0A2V1E777_9PLEO|nr:hypothetical protein DM02DRAFT_38709 [Periconia macrospinosa]
MYLLIIVSPPSPHLTSPHLTLAFHCILSVPSFHFISPSCEKQSSIPSIKINIRHSCLDPPPTEPRCIESIYNCGKSSRTICTPCSFIYFLRALTRANHNCNLPAYPPTITMLLYRDMPCSANREMCAFSGVNTLQSKHEDAKMPPFSLSLSHGLPLLHRSLPGSFFSFLFHAGARVLLQSTTNYSACIGDLIDGTR